jgi:hypothetical protein
MTSDPDLETEVRFSPRLVQKRLFTWGRGVPCGGGESGSVQPALVVGEVHASGLLPPAFLEGGSGYTRTARMIRVDPGTSCML